MYATADGRVISGGIYMVSRDEEHWRPGWFKKYGGEYGESAFLGQRVVVDYIYEDGLYCSGRMITGPKAGRGRWRFSCMSLSGDSTLCLWR